MLGGKITSLVVSGMLLCVGIAGCGNASNNSESVSNNLETFSVSEKTTTDGIEFGDTVISYEIKENWEKMEPIVEDQLYVDNNYFLNSSAESDDESDTMLQIFFDSRIPNRTLNDVLNSQTFDDYESDDLKIDIDITDSREIKISDMNMYRFKTHSNYEESGSKTTGNAIMYIIPLNTGELSLSVVAMGEVDDYEKDLEKVVSSLDINESATPSDSI